MQLLTILSRYQKPNIDRKRTSPSPVQKPPTQYKIQHNTALQTAMKPTVTIQ